MCRPVIKRIIIFYIVRIVGGRVKKFEPGTTLAGVVDIVVAERRPEDDIADRFPVHIEISFLISLTAAVVVNDITGEQVQG